jgi:hypothetical protein
MLASMPVFILLASSGHFASFPEHDDDELNKEDEADESL